MEINILSEANCIRLRALRKLNTLMGQFLLTVKLCICYRGSRIIHFTPKDETVVPS